jgi:DnaJ-class molecular chaperone
MIKKIEKSRIQCPNCEGCGKMAHYNQDSEKHELVTTICNVCKGNGIITGWIKIEYDDLRN